MLSTIIATLFIGPPAMAQSRWLESGRLDSSEISALCERASDVRALARAQMTTTGGERWLRLSRQQLVVEAFVMGRSPLDPTRCYVVARAGLAEETERRVFGRPTASIVRAATPPAPYWRHIMVIDIYAAMADGVWLYDPKAHALVPHMKNNLRALRGTRDSSAPRRSISSISRMASA
jgi:hypothetical protein